MTVTVTIPDELARSIPAQDMPRAVMEAFAVEQFRQRMWTVRDVRNFLQHSSREETERFLTLHDAFPAWSAEEILADADVARLSKVAP